MKRIFYYSSTAIILSCGISQAQTCVPTPTCLTLGYTSSSSCEGGIKCPFGEAWNCDLANKIAELEQKINQQQQQENCVIGSILYSDMTCSATVIDGKTPIAIIVYLDDNGGGQAMALKSLGNYKWGGYGTLVSGITSRSYASAASQDYNSCYNTEKIIAAGDKNTYPAAWAAHEYSTEGTKAGDWCLPAAGIFNSTYENQTIINIGFSRVGEVQFFNQNTTWSSTQYNANSAWSSGSTGYGLNYTDGFTDEVNYTKNSSYYVRPVLEF